MVMCMQNLLLQLGEEEERERSSRRDGRERATRRRGVYAEQRRSHIVRVWRELFFPVLEKQAQYDAALIPA